MANKVAKFFLVFLCLYVVQLSVYADENQITPRSFIWGSTYGLDNPYCSYASNDMSSYRAIAETDFFYETPLYFQLWKKDEMTGTSQCIIDMLPAYRVILVPEASRLYIVTDILLAYDSAIYTNGNDSACQTVLKSIVWSMCRLPTERASRATVTGQAGPYQRARLCHTIRPNK